MQLTAEEPSIANRTLRPANASGPALAIEAENLARRFGSVEALAQVSLSIAEGEFFSLLGPSGCGKTTLLRIIAGLDSPDEGTLKIHGRDAAGIPTHKRPVNTVFQSYALFPHMTVRDNIAFGLRMKRIGAAAIESRVRRVMELVQISELAARRPAQLSGGEKQRVALARAVVNEPEVLLLDEPLGALDLKLRKQLQVELHQLQRRLGITFIYVTHDQEEALVMSDRVAVMNAGRIEQVDAAADLYERPRTRFVAQFLGSCNLLEAEVKQVHGDAATLRTFAGELRVDFNGAGRRLTRGERKTLAIRPEKIAIAQTAGDAPSNHVPARIADLIYSGAETQYRLEVNGRILNVTALNAQAGRRPFHIGDVVMCHLPADALIVLRD